MRTESLTVRSIFDRALDIASEEERAAYLDEVCAAAPELRRKVDALLFAYASAGSFLEQPAVDREQTGVFCPVTESPGSQIGPYKLLEQIGEGGMGVVFMAEQTKPVQRRVALKIIKAGMDTREVVARFEAERQALAMMDHPNIARVLDAGTTHVARSLRERDAESPDNEAPAKRDGGTRSVPATLDTGRPYFVMELVRGVPMTEFCNQKNLSIRERLELFVTVCQAVQHAHQKGIIHRDIKPTNVLVTLHDGRPVIKVIDFGVAKATGQKLTDKTLFTGFTQMIGTPLYMSPEQAEMSGLDVDTRSDIFSVGVLLYELLTGTTPFDSQRLKSASFDELRRIIREEEPPRPSTRLTTLVAEAASTVGTQRKSDPRQLSKLFRGELDWIVMKCLEKDRTRRYETASALADDVERYLHDEPVQACPPSARYRFGKFARRNKGALLTAAVVMLALALGIVVSTWQAIRAFKAEVKATTSEQQANAALEFLVSAFQSPDPDRDGRTVTVAEVLDRSVRELQGKFTDYPYTKAELLGALGRSYWGLGLFREAIPLHEEARDLFLGTVGREHPDTLAVTTRLATSYRELGRFAEALALDQEALRIRKAKLGPDHPDTLVSMMNLSTDYYFAGRLDEALRLKEETFTLSKAKLGPQNRLTLETMCELARANFDAGRRDEGLAMLEQTIKLQKASLGPDDPSTLVSMSNLSDVYRDAGRLSEAIAILEESLKLYKAKLGPEHASTLKLMGRLGAAYAESGRLTEAIPILEETLKLCKIKLGPDAVVTLESMDRLADAYFNAGRNSESLQLLGDELKVRLAKHGPNGYSTCNTITRLREVASNAGMYAEAEAIWRDAVRISPNSANTHYYLGDDLIHQGKIAEAEAEMRDAVRLLPDDGLAHGDTLASIKNLAVAYKKEKAGGVDAALCFDEKLLEIRKAILGLKNHDTLELMRHVAGSYIDAGRIDDAVRLSEETLKLCKALLGPTNCDTLTSMDDVANSYSLAGRYEEALSLREEEFRIEKATRGSDELGQLETMVNLESDYVNLDRFDDAARLGEETLKLMKVKVGPEHRDTLILMLILGNAYRAGGRLDDAIALVEQVLKLQRAKLGLEHQDTLRSMNDLADAYVDLGRLAEAVPMLEETLKLRKAKLGLDHPETLSSMSSLARGYGRVGRQAEALPLMEQALKLRKGKLGREHPDTLESMHTLAEAYLRVTRLAEAEALARECLETSEERLPDNWRTFDTRSLLGAVLLGQKKYADAEPLMVSGYEGLHDRVAKIPAYDKSRLKDALKRLVHLYEATNRPEKVAEWKAKLAEFGKANSGVPKNDAPPAQKAESASEPKAPSPGTNKSAK